MRDEFPWVVYEFFSLGTGDIDPIFIYIGDFDEIPPFGSVDFDPFEIFQVEIVSVEPEKSVTAEIGHVASEFLLLDLPYGGDLFGMKLRDVEQSEDMQSFVVHEDATRNGE